MGIYDARGRMVAQANTGTPGHINSLSVAGEALAKIFDGKLEPLMETVTGYLDMRLANVR